MIIGKLEELGNHLDSYWATEQLGNNFSPRNQADNSGNIQSPSKKSKTVVAANMFCHQQEGSYWKKVEELVVIQHIPVTTAKEFTGVHLLLFSNSIIWHHTKVHETNTFLSKKNSVPKGDSE